MKNTVLICMALIAISPSTGRCGEAPRQSMRDGIRFYNNKTYDSAAESFERAALSAQQQKLDASVAQYNEANARFKMGQFGAATTNFSEATRSPDLALQSKAYYNRGNALVTASEGFEKQGGLDTAVGSVDEALEMYENAMALAPKDEDAKVNYELALKRKQELRQKQQQQQQKQDNKDQQKEDPSRKEEEKNKKSDQQKQDEQKNQQQDQKKDQQQKNNEQSQPEKQAADQQQQKAQS
jgi:Ca-activated chloride channel homolog